MAAASPQLEDSVQRAAELFDAGEMYTAGLVFAEEVGDADKAHQCYSLGAELGRARRAECLLQLGYCCKFGSGTDVDEERAFAHFSAAVDAAVQAQRELRDDVDADADERDERLEKLAEVEAEAAYCMAASLEDGAGIAPNVALAYEWYARGARLRNADCLLALGNACLHGHAQGGVERDEARAAELFATGVEIDSPACIRALAACYVRGAGVVPSVQRVRRVFDLLVFVLSLAHLLVCICFQIRL